MASFPTLPVFDDCNRADENPLSQGGAWAFGVEGWAGPLQLVSNRVLRTGVSHAASYRVTRTSGNNAEFYCTVPVLPAVAGGVYIALYDQPVAAPNGYETYFSQSGLVEIYRITAGAATLLTSTTLSPVLRAGDAVGIWRYGSRIVVFVRRDGVWGWALTGTDGNHLGPWHGAFAVDDGTARLDNFGGGSLVLEAPENTTPETARVITVDPVPYVDFLDVSQAEGSNYEVWYKFVATETDTLGMWFASVVASVYDPRVFVFTGTADNLTTYRDFTGAPGYNVVNLRIIVPVVAGDTYFFRVRQNAVAQPDAPLRVTADNLPIGAVSQGELLINDFVVGMPLIVLSPDDGSVIAGIPVFPAGDYGDILTTGQHAGVSLWESDNELLTQQRAVLVDKFLRPATNIDFPSNNTFGKMPITGNRTDRFFVGLNPSSQPTVYEVSAEGLLSARTWTLSGETHLDAMGVDSAARILYWIGNVGNPAAIHRFDLVQNAALSDLAAAPPANYFHIRDLIVLGDGSVLAGYAKTVAGLDYYIKRYSSAGATLNTYNFGTVGLNRFARGVTEATFWAWLFPDGTDLTTRFQEIRISDGVVLREFDGVAYDDGIYGPGVATDSPIGGAFGPDHSCPILIYPPPITSTIPFDPPGDDDDPDNPPPLIMTSPPEKSKIPVRLRRAPHMSDEQLLNFFERIQFDFESGVGLNEITTGHVPRCMVRWSDDGGHTWSQERHLSFGRIGQFRYRTQLYRMGRSRDRIYEVKVSDPVHSRLLAAYLDVSGGLS